MAPILVNKVHQKWHLTKSGINESFAPNFKFFNEKKNWNDSDDFWHRKLTLKTQKSPIWSTWRYVNSQNTTISLKAIHFFDNQANFVPTNKKLHDLTDIIVDNTPNIYLKCLPLITFFFLADVNPVDTQLDFAQQLYNLHLSPKGTNKLP